MPLSHAYWMTAPNASTDMDAMQMITFVILPPKYRRDAEGNLVEEASASPCPELLTAEEACRYLRLDDTCHRRPRANAQILS